MKVSIAIILSSSSVLIIIIIELISAGSAAGKQNEIVNIYQRCEQFSCGNISFPFPFSNSDTFGTTGQYSCGLPLFKIYCDQSDLPKVELSGNLYEIKDIFTDPDRLLTVFDQRFTESVESGSCNDIRNLSIPLGGTHTGLTFASGVVNLTIFECPLRTAVDGIAGSFKCNEGSWAYVWNSTQLGPAVPKTPDGCQHAFFPVSGASLPKIRFGGNQSTWLSSVLREGFVLQWQNLPECTKCITDFGGRCVYDATSSTNNNNNNNNNIACFCDYGLCG
ncbi:uncharacterized protein LOC124916645 [Impatiens glandulifera]|uniref:uncharacterized protein LOC124916645 n=1 Tax=Impatiens glandulifera TaxID=253017 RepID=UPI001FB140EA|nr:uncharacterized protein LOC124916645 [Impatiens glandulifera]